MSGGPSTATTTQKTNQKTTQDTSGTSSGTTTEAGTRTADIPEWLQGLVGGATDITGQGLSNVADMTNAYQLPPEALQALQSTAAGNYLYGGPGQQAFIDASVRAAQPGIYSQFGASGPGGGGLERAALNQSAVDAYARMYGDERSRQLTAAAALPGITQIPLELQQKLTALGGSLPGAFAPFLGASTAGTGATTGQTQEHMTGQTSGTSTTTQPVFQQPPWLTGLGAFTSLAGLAMPGLGGTSALGGIGQGLFGSGAMSNFNQGGLLGLFR